MHAKNGWGGGQNEIYKVMNCLLFSLQKLGHAKELVDISERSEWKTSSTEYVHSRFKNYIVE